MAARLVIMETKLPDLPPAALALDIDEDALAANWKVLDRLSGTARAGAAVKADAYGLGASRAARVLAAAGCRDFFVAHWGEAGAVRQAAPSADISVLHGPLTDADCAHARTVGARPVINSLQQARRWLAAGGGPCDLMVDTGMNRLGVALHELGDEAVGRLDIDILLSHLVAGEEDTALNHRQLARWREARAAVSHRRASLANSAGIALGEAFHGDLTRPGIALYGGIPRAELGAQIRQVAFPRAAILQTRDVAAGETIGYNATFTAPRPMRVGTLAIGYADGYLRCWSDIGTFAAGGAVLRVLGRVSMDLTVIDLSNAPDLEEGDWVTAEYSLPVAAETAGLSQYELLTVLGRRFRR